VGHGRRLLGCAGLVTCAGCWLMAPTAPDAHRFFLMASAAAFFNDLTMGAVWATCQDIGRRHAGESVAAVTHAVMIRRGVRLLFNGAPLWRRDKGGTMRELPPLRSAFPPISPVIQTAPDCVPCLN